MASTNLQCSGPRLVSRAARRCGLLKPAAMSIVTRLRSARPKGAAQTRGAGVRSSSMVGGDIPAASRWRDPSTGS